MKIVKLALICCVLISSSFSAFAKEMRMAVTTSFNNSGLADLLLPEIKSDLGFHLRLIVVGTGQALRLGRTGDVDAILVHSKTAEEEFVSDGFATHRRDIMYNDFVIVGPKEDPAKISKSKTISDALTAIAATKSKFVSRGDDSGTHRKEVSIWQKSKLDNSRFESAWYLSAGSGMGASLNTANGLNAYIMSDRASWLKFKNKGNLKLLFEGDPLLFNQYGFLPVNKQKHPHVKATLSKDLETWLVSKKAQELIGAYKINGEILFVPNATKD